MMRSATRALVASLPVTVTAVVVLMFAAPAALAGGSPSTLTFVVQPTTTQVATVMTPTVTVRGVKDQWGNPATCTACVTLTYFDDTNTLGQPEPTNNVANAVNGVATFPDLTFSAVGFSFELQASAGHATSGASNSFNIVTQLLHCPAGQCQSETVTSQGTSGFAVASQASATDVLTATGGGFPNLFCTTVGGVTSFTFTGGSKTITMMLAKNLVQQAPGGPGAAHFNICWGQSSPFTTKPDTPLEMNNGEFEGLLPDCSAGVPAPCITSRHKTKAGVEVITISAPPGDPHSSF